MMFITKKNIKIPKRKQSSHKGDNGRVLAIGGSIDYVGAITLAGIAALRSGADICVIAAPEKVAWAVNALSPDVITKKFDGDYFTLKHVPKILRMSQLFDVVLIGNGLGIRKETLKFSKAVISRIKKLKVIDADALKAVSIKEVENALLTPHAKELEIFLRNSGRTDIIKKLQKEKNPGKKARILQHELRPFLAKDNVILLKGPADIIVSATRMALNKTGNAGMTKGGTGDVLAGLCAGFLAQSRDLWQSAINSAYINGLIGDMLLKRKKGFTYLASDMVNEIAAIKKKF